MIRLPRSGLPRGFLTRQHDRQAIEIGDDAAIDGLVDREQPCLVCQELADGDALFALLRELRPVRAHAFFVVEPAARVGDGERHRGQALGGRVDDHHRVLLPRLARLLVADTAPEIDDLLAAVIRAARAAQLVASREVVGKRLAHRLEPRTDLSVHARSCRAAPRPISAAVSRRRNRTIASTTTQSRNTPMLMRSHSPIHGVGRFAATRGASRNVNAPNVTRITKVAME